MNAFPHENNVEGILRRIVAGNVQGCRLVPKAGWSEPDGEGGRSPEVDHGWRGKCREVKFSGIGPVHGNAQSGQIRSLAVVPDGKGQIGHPSHRSSSEIGLGAIENGQRTRLLHDDGLRVSHKRDPQHANAQERESAEKV